MMTSHSDAAPLQDRVRFGLDIIWAPDTQNEIFRLLMQAMARPGSLHCAKASLKKSDSDAVTAVLAALTDAHVTACNYDDLIRSGDWSLTQCQTSTAEFADYIVCDGSRACSITPKLGSLASPEQSATIVIVVPGVVDTPGTSESLQARITGPGVNGSQTIGIDGIDPSWLDKHQEWNSQFPLGVDFLIVSQSSIVALPRTTQLEVLK